MKKKYDGKARRRTTTRTRIRGGGMGGRGGGRRTKGKRGNPLRRKK